MRAWRTSIGFVVETGPTSAPILSSQVDTLPDPRWRALQDFVVLDEFGIVLRRYHAHVWSIEDDLGMTVHAVIDGSFRSLTVTEHMAANYRINKDEETILPDLKPVPEDDVEAKELIEEGLQADRNLSLHQAQDRIREAERILPSRPSTTDEDPEHVRVVRLVRGRVEAYALPLDKTVLQTLATFGGLRRSLSTSSEALAAFQPALAHFLLACRRCCFDPTLSQEERGPAPIVGSFLSASEEDRNALRTLVGTLGALEKELLLVAEGQEYADANRNAAEFRAAADHVAQAREQLAACLER